MTFYNNVASDKARAEQMHYRGWNGRAYDLINHKNENLRKKLTKLHEIYKITSYN